MASAYERLKAMAMNPVATLTAFPENAKLAGAGIADAVDHLLGGKSTLAADVVAKEVHATEEQKAQLQQLEIDKGIVETAARKTVADVKDAALELASGLTDILVAAGIVGAILVGSYVFIEYKVIKKSVGL